MSEINANIKLMTVAWKDYKSAPLTANITFLVRCKFVGAF